MFSGIDKLVLPLHSLLHWTYQQTFFNQHVSLSF